MEPFAHADRRVGKFIAANAVLELRINSFLCSYLLAGLLRAEYSLDEFLDHALSLSCRNNWPAVLFGMRAQTVVGVNGDWVADGFHEGKVVV